MRDLKLKIDFVWFDGICMFVIVDFVEIGVCIIIVYIVSYYNIVCVNVIVLSWCVFSF